MPVAATDWPKPAEMPCLCCNTDWPTVAGLCLPTSRSSREHHSDGFCIICGRVPNLDPPSGATRPSTRGRLPNFATRPSTRGQLSCLHRGCERSLLVPRTEAQRPTPAHKQGAGQRTNKVLGSATPMMHPTGATFHASCGSRGGAAALTPPWLPTARSPAQARSLAAVRSAPRPRWQPRRVAAPPR